MILNHEELEERRRIRQRMQEIEEESYCRATHDGGRFSHYMGNLPEWLECHKKNFVFSWLPDYIYQQLPEGHWAPVPATREVLLQAAEQYAACYSHIAHYGERPESAQNLSDHFNFGVAPVGRSITHPPEGTPEHRLVSREEASRLYEAAYVALQQQRMEEKKK